MASCKLWEEVMDQLKVASKEISAGGGEKETTLTASMDTWKSELESGWGRGL